MRTSEILIKLSRRPTYLKILALLCKSPATVSKLVRETHSKRSRIKNYLNDLIEEGLVEEYSIGGIKLYRLTEEGKKLC